MTEILLTELKQTNKQIIFPNFILAIFVFKISIKNTCPVQKLKKKIEDNIFKKFHSFQLT